MSVTRGMISWMKNSTYKNYIMHLVSALFYSPYICLVSLKTNYQWSIISKRYENQNVKSPPFLLLNLKKYKNRNLWKLQNRKITSFPTVKFEKL